MMDEIRECERQYWQAIERWNEARRRVSDYATLALAARSVAYWRDQWARAVARADRKSLSAARAEISGRLERN